MASRYADGHWFKGLKRGKGIKKKKKKVRQENNRKRNKKSSIY